MLLRQHLTTLNRHHPPKSHFSTRTQMKNQNDPVTLQWKVLGFGHENAVFVPSLNPYLGDDPAQCVAFGGVHSVALTSLGKIFAWSVSCKGYGGFGALGHSVYHKELFPRLVEGSWNGKIRHIATLMGHIICNNLNRVVLLKRPVFFEMKEMEDWALVLVEALMREVDLVFPSKVKALPVPMAAVSCGGLFTTVLTEERQLWNWGASSNYEVGRGDKVGGWRPKPIPSLEDVRIIQIASGGCHSLALTHKIIA
ncbi:hypothetical protein Pint_32813 [Pistacia integerrima]|uniref:Uncharacterized protein n=1 Tax=Pistacia integerrima TaxID=434235 RepID=A0ACC0X737_9ROSI|nr:hypothetical protein Pint_32813 [Pistacia integerrima]